MGRFLLQTILTILLLGYSSIDRYTQVCRTIVRNLSKSTTDFFIGKMGYSHRIF